MTHTAQCLKHLNLLLLLLSHQSPVYTTTNVQVSASQSSLTYQNKVLP